MSIKVPSHLYRNRHGTFYFRLLIPRDLRAIVTRTEFRFSLQTEQRREAITSALPLIAGLPELLENFRTMTDEDGGTTPHDYFKLWLKEKRGKGSLFFTSFKTQQLTGIMKLYLLRLEKELVKNGYRVTLQTEREGQISETSSEGFANFYISLSVEEVDSSTIKQIELTAIEKVRRMGPSKTLIPIHDRLI